jgi:hypothetical protein
MQAGAPRLVGSDSFGCELAARYFRLDVQKLAMAHARALSERHVSHSGERGDATGPADPEYHHVNVGRPF